jgi:hypothetical protein
MHFLIQHNEISKTQLFLFLPQKKSLFLQASVMYSPLKTTEKRREFNLETHTAFLDLEKALDKRKSK